MLVSFEAHGLEIQRYRKVICAVTDKEPVTGLTKQFL
jgi:hypothetical protein